MSKDVEQLSRRTRNRYLTKTPGHAISRLLVVLIGITLFLAVGAHILQRTVLNAHFVAAEVTKSDYVNEATTNVNNVVADLASSNGVPASLASGLVTSKQVKEDLTEVVENVYKGKTNAIDSQKIKQQVSQNISLKAQSAGVSTNNEEFAAVQSSLLGSVDNYLNQTIQDRYLDRVTEMVKNIDKGTKIVFWVSTIATVVLAVLLLLHERAFLRWLHYLGLAALWSGLLMAVLAFAANNSGFFAQIAERAAQASGLAENLLELVAVNFQSAGLLLALCGLFGIVVGFFRKKA